MVIQISSQAKLHPVLTGRTGLMASFISVTSAVIHSTTNNPSTRNYEKEQEHACGYPNHVSDRQRLAIVKPVRSGKTEKPEDVTDGLVVGGCGGVAHARIIAPHRTRG